jgi:hypothetical protein
MLQTIKMILQLVPIILEMIKAVEAAIPEEGKGKDKLAFIRESLTTVYPDIVNVWGMVEKIITSAVALYNNTGVFKKG